MGYETKSTLKENIYKISSEEASNNDSTNAVKKYFVNVNKDSRTRKKDMQNTDKLNDCTILNKNHSIFGRHAIVRKEEKKIKQKTLEELLDLYFQEVSLL